MPCALSRAVGKFQSVLRCGSTTMMRSLPRSAMRSAPGKGPLCVMTRFGSGCVVVVVVPFAPELLLCCVSAPRSASAASTERTIARRTGTSATLSAPGEQSVRLHVVLAAGDTHVLEPALRGGVDVVQLREKTLSDRELVRAARAFRRACTRHRAL